MDEDGEAEAPAYGRAAARKLAETVVRQVAEIHANLITAIRLLADVHSVVVHGRKPVTPAAPPNPRATEPVSSVPWDAISKLIDPLGALLGGRKRK